MSMAKDCPTLEVSSAVAVENEVELSLGLSIGRDVGTPKLQNSGAESTDVVVTSQVAETVGCSEEESDMIDGDTEGNSNERKRKRDEISSNGFDEIRERSKEMETIGSKSFTGGEIDAQVLSAPVLHQNESSTLMPVVSGSFGLNQELVTGGGGSGGEDDAKISRAGSSSVLSSGFKSGTSQQDGSSKSGEESGTDPIGIHTAMTATEVISNPAINEPSSLDPKPPSPTNTNTTQVEEPHNNLQTFRLPRIPFVTTTGNGPNGRTVSGFLYKYTNAEVSIVCSCHGNSFSPAQFVEHAGGVNISSPLRHIIVKTSAFTPFTS